LPVLKVVVDVFFDLPEAEDSDSLEVIIVDDDVIVGVEYFMDEVRSAEVSHSSCH
jgi:hypothetical protein